MPPESYSDIIKGGKLPDRPVVVRTSAGSTPAPKTSGVSSVFEQGTGRNLPPVRHAQCRDFEEIETVAMPPAGLSVTAPSKWAELYALLERLGVNSLGKQLTKQEREGLYRWALKNKKPLQTRKTNDGPTPYTVWVKPEEPK